MRRQAFALPAALVLYIGILAGAIWLLSLDTLSQTLARPLVVLLSLGPAAAIVILGVRWYQRLDELKQRIHLIALAVAFLGTLLLAFTGIWVALVGQTEAIIDILIRFGSVGVSFSLFAGVVALYVVGWLWARRQYR